MTVYTLAGKRYFIEKISPFFSSFLAAAIFSSESSSYIASSSIYFHADLIYYTMTFLRYVVLRPYNDDEEIISYFQQSGARIRTRVHPRRELYLLLGYASRADLYAHNTEMRKCGDITYATV